MNKEKVFLRLITYGPLFFIPLFVVVLVAFSYNINIKGFDLSIEQLEQDLVKVEKKSVKDKVLNITDLIIYEKSVIKDRLIARVKNRVETAYEIAQNIYNDYKDTKTEQEIKEVITSALKSFSWNNGESYIWIADYNGVHSLLTESMKHLEGIPILDFQDADGRYVIQEEIAICKEKGEGFIWDTFTKPEDKTNRQYKQVAFVKDFGHYDWYFGSAEFLDTATKITDKELFKMIDRIDNIGDNYVFLINTKGNMLVNRYTPQLLGENVEITDKFVKNTIQNTINNLKNKESADYTYGWYNKSTKKIEKKYSYIQKVPNTDWIIGSGYFLSDIQNKIFQQKTEMLKNYSVKSSDMFYMAILVIVLSLIFSFYVSIKIKKSFSDYKDSIGDKTAQLQELNQTLEHKVKEALHTLNSVIDNTSNLIFYKDSDFNYMGCNKSFEEYMGHTRDELIGHNDFDFFPEELAQHFRELDQKMFNENRSIVNPQWVTYPDGRKVFLHTTTTPFYDINGEVMGLVGNSVDITKEKLLTNKLEQQANYDHLTKIPNRSLFMDRLSQSIKQANRQHSNFAVFFMDLDKFKPINDTLGHHFGDTILQIVAKRLSESVRESDTVARLGGDEFAVIVSNAKGEADVTSLAQKLIEAIDKPIVVEEKSLHVTLSIGVAFYTHDGLSSDELLSLADNAMYMAKENGRNCFVLAENKFLDK